MCFEYDQALHYLYQSGYFAALPEGDAMQMFVNPDKGEWKPPAPAEENHWGIGHRAVIPTIMVRACRS